MRVVGIRVGTEAEAGIRARPEQRRGTSSTAAIACAVVTAEWRDAEADTCLAVREERGAGKGKEGGNVSKRRVTEKWSCSRVKKETHRRCNIRGRCNRRGRASRCNPVPRNRWRNRRARRCTRRERSSVAGTPSARSLGRGIEQRRPRLARTRTFPDGRKRGAVACDCVSAT